MNIMFDIRRLLTPTRPYRHLSLWTYSLPDVYCPKQKMRISAGMWLEVRTVLAFQFSLVFSGPSKDSRSLHWRALD